MGTFLANFKKRTIDMVVGSFIAVLSYTNIHCEYNSWEGKCSTFVLPVDKDGDGFIHPTNVEIHDFCDEFPSELWDEKFALPHDCNDDEVTVHLGAKEICDLLDNDCNGQTDENLKTYKWYNDYDKDGYITSKNAIEPEVTCIDKKATPDADFYISEKNILSVLEKGSDCDDYSAKIHPGAEDTPCDKSDTNCDGIIEKGSRNFYQDIDGDNEGNPDVTIIACEKPNGYVENKDDCNDSSASIRNGINISSLEILCDPKSIPAYFNEKVYINTKEGLLVAINKNRKIDWTTETIGRNPVIAIGDPGGQTEIWSLDDKMYIHTLDNQILRIYISNGELSYENKMFGTYQVAIATDGKPYFATSWFTPPLDNPEFPSPSGGVFPFNFNECSYLIGYYISGLTINKNNVINVVVDNTLYTIPQSNDCIEPTVHKLDTISLTSPIFGKDDMLYFITNENNLQVYESNFLLYWEKPWVGSFAAINNISAVYSSQKAVSVSGSEIWKKNNPSSNGTVTLQDNLFYFYGEDGIQKAQVYNGEILSQYINDSITNTHLYPQHLIIEKNGVITFCNTTDQKIYSICATDKIDETAYWPIEAHDQRRTRNAGTIIKDNKD